MKRPIAARVIVAYDDFSEDVFSYEPADGRALVAWDEQLFPDPEAGVVDLEAREGGVVVATSQFGLMEVCFTFRDVASIWHQHNEPPT